MNRDVLWDKVRLLLKEKITNLSYETWIEPLALRSIDENEGRIYLSWPNQPKLITHINENYLSYIESAIEKCSGKKYKAEIKPAAQSEALTSARSMPPGEIVEMIIQECFESDEMKEYLLAHPEVLSVEKLRDIISGAMIPLSLKVQLMKDVDCDACRDMKEALVALDLKPGKFFVLSVEANADTNETTESESDYIGPCTDLEKVREYISEYFEHPEEGRLWEKRLDTGFWFTLELYEFRDGGQLFNSFTYYLIGDEVCYFDKGIHGSDDGFLFDHDSRYSWDCLDLNISIPFKPGDIVTVDGRPFCAPRHVLLLEVGDDCCGVWAMYKKTDGSWDTGAVKHGTVYDIGRNGILSPLYRLKKYEDVLTDDERILEDISSAIKKMELVSTQ